MAYRKVTLPVLKLTHRPTAGRKSSESIHRGIFSQLQNPVEPEDNTDYTPPCLDSPTDTATAHCSITDNLVEPTGHELESRSIVAGWDCVRSGIIGAVTEVAAMPIGQLCHICEEAASLRCHRCGPLGFYCPVCFQKCHSRVNIFHVAEKWEDNHYVPFIRADQHVDVHPQHLCTTKKEVYIHCVDEFGMEHKIFFTACDCEPLAVTLARAELWPATPHNPKFAFTFALLDWAEALMLECQVALKDFCNCLKFKSPFQTLKRKDVYSSLIDSFEEYRFLKHKLRHLDYLLEDLDPGNICPACPQDDGKYICSMDALFGLPRKKAAGVSYREPLHGDLFFNNQSAVDQFVVENSEQSTSMPNACNDFLAGSMLRSANRYRALDETAVFGYCCRHEFPGKYINLKHGERLAYAVWMLENILQSHSQSASQSHLFVMYDIACTLFSHLKSQQRYDILNKTHLCLPTFHSYGHKVSCQVLFGPRRCEGIGLSDGETMERLWSYLRRFSRMTKEMRPAHRIDVLTSALVYYGIQTKEKLALLLLTRWERALRTKLVAEETLHQLITCPLHEIDSTVKQWLCEETESCNVSYPRTKPIQWQVSYFQTLQDFYSLRNRLGCGTITDAVNYTHLALLDKTLTEYEKKYSISQRWLPSDKEYKDCMYTVLLTKREQLLLHIWKAGQRRMFLLKLKKKYADGQKVAKKLSAQITKESRIIRTLLEEYQACQSGPNPSLTSDPITLSEALDPSLVESRLREVGSFCSSVAYGKKREIIDSYLSLCRSKEEIYMLKQEAQNVVSYYRQRKEILLKELESRSSDSNLFNRGSAVLLHSLLTKTDVLFEKSNQILQVMLEEAAMEVEDSDDSSDYSSDDDVLHTYNDLGL